MSIFLTFIQLSRAIILRIKTKIILLICLCSLFSNLWGDELKEQRISFHFSYMPLRSVLQQLSEKHHFNFIFNDEIVDNIRISCKVVNESPYTALKKLLKSEQFSYEFLTQNTIIIRRTRKQTKLDHVLNGQVRDAETGSPLVCANAYIQGKRIGSSTDLNGNFKFTIPDSTLQLIVSYMGYETEIQPVSTQSEKLDIRLHPRPLESNSIIITAKPIPEELEQLSQAQLNDEYLIGVVPDISTNMTYASFMNYNDDVVYVNLNNSAEEFYIKITGNRLHPMIGTDRNNRLSFKQHHVKLNGFHLQMPYHTSIVPAINPGITNYDLIQKSDYNTSVFDVEYVDAYESVLDLHYRKGNPNKISGKGTIDLLNSGIMLEGPLTDNASWIIMGKKSYINDLLDPIQKSNWMSYGYYDFQTQLDIRPMDQHNIRINYMYSTDHMSFDPQISYCRERMLSNSQSGQPSSEMILAEENIHEMNFDDTQFKLNGIMAYDSCQISNHWRSEVFVSFAEQRYHNKQAWSVEHNISLPDISDSTYNYLWSEGKHSNFKNKSWIEKFVLHYSASPDYLMKTGLHLEQLSYNTDMKNNLLVRIDENISEPPGYNRAYNNTKIINTYSFFYQEERRLFTKLRIQTGVRYDHTNLLQKGKLNPRISIRYDLPYHIIMRTAFGTFSRLPAFGEIRQHMLQRFEPGYKPGDSEIEFQRINKYNIGLGKMLVPHALLEFNYFYKDMKNLIPIQRLSDGSLIYDVKKRASVTSHGFDINAKLSLNILSLMCKYKYMDSFEYNSDQQNYFYYLDQRHSLSLLINTALPKDWNIELQGIYGSGYAYTPCVQPEFDWELGYDLDSTPIWEYQTNNPNSKWYPEYSRLDLMIRKRFSLPLGRITMSVKLINLLSTRQIFSYIYTYDYDGKPIRHEEKLISFFPQIGLAYEF